MSTATCCAPNVVYLQENVKHNQDNLCDNNNNTRAHAHAREDNPAMRQKVYARMAQSTHAIAAEEIGPWIRDAYKDAIGRPMPGCVASEIKGFLAKGLDAGCVVAALEYTAAAPRPAWAYTRYMLRLAYERGCKDSLDFMRLTGQADDLPL